MIKTKYQILPCSHNLFISADEHWQLGSVTVNPSGNVMSKLNIYTITSDFFYQQVQIHQQSSVDRKDENQNMHNSPVCFRSCQSEQKRLRMTDTAFRKQSLSFLSNCISLKKFFIEFMTVGL
jgi:hypothetical protein